MMNDVQFLELAITHTKTDEHPIPITHLSLMLFDKIFAIYAELAGGTSDLIY